MNPNKQNVRKARNINKRRKDFTENNKCRNCKYYQGHKRGCKIEMCCLEDEKLKKIKVKFKRERRERVWDM